MRRRIPAVVMSSLLLATAIAAPASEDPDAPPARDVHLLDEVPNYAEILKHQWSAGLPQDAIQAEDTAAQYGRLGVSGPLTATSLQECIALALQNNTDLQIQRLGPTAGTAGVRQARAIFDPKFSANAVSLDRTVIPATTFLTAGSANSVFTADRNLNVGLNKLLLSGGSLALQWTNQRVNTIPSIANTVIPKYVTTLGLSLTQPLLRDFGWSYALLVVEIAQNTEQEDYFQYQAGIANLVTQVERAYWALVLAIEAVEVQEQGLAAAKELERQNEGKFNVGAMAHTSVLEAQAEVARRESNLIRTRNLREITRDNLRALINYKAPDTGGLLMIDPQDKPTVVPYDPDLERSLRTAIEKRPELTAAKLDVHGRGLQRKVAENQLLPKLNFVGQLGLNGLSGGRPVVPFGQNPIDPSSCTITNNVIVCPTPSTNNTQAPAFVGGGYGRSLDLLTDGRFYNYSAGAVVEIPLDNAQAKANYAQANINLDQSRLSLQKLQEVVTLEIKNAVANLETDLKSVDATRLARELEEENVRNQKARYDVGLATTKDLLDYLDRLTQAQFLEVQALTAYNSDLAEMRRVEGTLLSARNISLERVSPEKAPWWASF